ncbi:YncE family protein [Pedobacter sp. Hv1]|uniref:YncE family protein n=1 Tax=Pedobacter sp. Hv1 TaxID=1740090 RepID=UPI0006D8AC44|nr:DUF5074 domain-containing protein [Pedobacter sp. Hv1]KQC00997.1 hypothetical protein AQF98_10015 [Pedobacter sp. Hv1]
MKFNNYLKTTSLAFVAVVLLFSSCKKDRQIEKAAPEISGTKGIYVLSEGLWNRNNSTIAYYDIAKGTVEADIYSKVNATNLGETANDLQAYGSKMYCVVSGIKGSNNSFVDVMSIATGKSLKRISFNGATNLDIPRYVTFYQNKAYVSRYDGVISRIDTATMTVDSELQLMNGTNKAAVLEGITVANGKLYVTNAVNDYASPNSLKTKVTVVDLATFKKTKDIEVGPNPSKIATAANGDVYAITWNVYGQTNKPTLVRINSITDAVTQTEEYDLGAITIAKSQAWVTKDLYSGSAEIRSLNLTTGKLGNALITDGTVVSSPYGITINPFDNTVVVSNNAGATKTAFVFGADGKKKFSFATGEGPQTAVFNYSYK